MKKTDSLDEKDMISKNTGEEWDEKLTALQQRLIFLAEDFAPSRGKYEYLEKRTGISAARWQNLFLRRLMPTADMILAISSYRRDKTEWLLTGYVSKNHTALLQQNPDEALWSEFLEQQKYLERKRKKEKSSEENN